MLRLTYRTVVFAALISLLSTSATVHAQGVIIDQRPEIPVPGSFTVKQLDIHASIRDQVAEVQVSQTFHNPTRSTMEVEYRFPLPEDGAVQSLTLLVDGKEMPGRILPRDQARRIYEDIVRRKKDPALMEYMGRGLFRTEVFPVPAGADRKVTLRYTQLCDRDRQTVGLVYPLATQRYSAKPIQTISFRATIDSSDPLKAIYCPTHDMAIHRDGSNRATISMQMHDQVPSGDVRLFYTLDDAAIGGSVLSYWPADADEGFFCVLASPGLVRGDRKPMAKTVLFVLDKSGSMSGKKIDQARNAVRFVLNNLNDGDTFNLIAYDDRVAPFKDELQRYDPQSRTAALAWVDNIHDGGSTNIAQALQTAMGMIHDPDRPGYVLFLTDGLPTAGEQNEMKIARLCEQANDHDARLFAFGVGFDVNARLLDRLANGNGGVSEYVKPDQDIEATVSRFYGRLTAPVLSDVAVTLAGIPINRAYPRDLPDMFDGGQVVYVGRYGKAGATSLNIRGKIEGREQSFEFPVELTARGGSQRYSFVETLWAQRRVGDLIDQIDLHGRSDELMRELVDLSSRYGILTPYTSYLADEDVALGATMENVARADRASLALDEVSGRSGTMQRAYKQSLKAAPTAGARPETTALEAADAAIAARANNAIAYDTQGNARVARSVRNIANRALYRKGEQWIDASLTDAQQSNPIEIRQFSDEYFELSRQLTPAENQLLTFEEDLLVNIRGQAYRILAAEN